MFYTKSLLLRTINPKTDQATWTQWLNDPEYLSALTMGPLRPTFTAQSHQMLQDITKSAQDSKLPIFALCDRPPPSKDEDEGLGPDDDPFETQDGKARHPMIGMLVLKPARGGTVDRVAALGINLDRAHVGRGLGREALEWACWYLFDVLGYHRFELATAMSNVRAQRCYEKVGFVREGVLRECYFWEGEWRDVLLMAILEKEWRARRKGRVDVEK